MNKKYYISISLIVIVILIGWTYFWAFNKKNKYQDPMEFFPDTPGLIFQTDHGGMLINTLFYNNKLWNELNKIPQINDFRKNIITIDSNLNKSAELYNILHDAPLFIGLYPNKDQHISSLVLIQLQKRLKIEKLRKKLYDNLPKEYTIFYDKIDGYPVLKLINGKKGIKLIILIKDNNLIISHSNTLISYNIHPVSKSKNHFSTQNEFITVSKTAGKNADARVYINYNQFSKMIQPLIKTNLKKQVKWISNFAGWTELDLFFGDKKLLLSGYTITKKNNYLNSFQNPGNIIPYNIFPFNTNILIQQEFTDFKLHPGFLKIKHYSPKYQGDFVKLSKLIKGAAYITNAHSVNAINSQSYGVVSFSNPVASAQLLKNIALKSGEKILYRYDNFYIRKIRLPQLLSDLFGNVFSNVKGNYYTIINDVAVFANSKTALTQLIQFSVTGKTLDLNENFKTFSENLVNNVNLMAVINFQDFINIAPAFLSPSTDLFLNKNHNVINKFGNIAIQYSRNNSLFYTTISFNYSQKTKDENLALWKLQLEDQIIGKPFLVKNHSTGKNDIIAFDKGNRMYLINYQGKIEWTKRLTDLPVSNIYSVDYYKNGKIQFLFNTNSNLMLIDRKGRFVADYPIRLYPKATNGLSLFDYNKRKNYRILIGQADKRVYNYTIKGSAVKGWKNPQMPDKITSKIYRILTNRKDYIIITDDKNHIKIVDRRGRQRIVIKKPFKKAKNSGFFVNKTNNKGIIITTDSKGQLVYISSKGNVRFTNFGIFSPNHYFLYADFNGNGSKDFIFIDKNKLQVFNRYKKKLFSFTFPDNINIKPEFFNLGNNNKILGVVVSGEKTIYLFSKNGNILISKGLTGSTPFTVGSLKNNSNINLISASGNILYNYRLK